MKTAPTWCRNAFSDCVRVRPWRHHVEIVNKCKTVEEALFYIRKTIENGLSRSAMIDILKAGFFEPEFAGKLNFYVNVNAVNELIRTPDENPTIGLLICKDKDQTEVQWAFQGDSDTNGSGFL